MKEFKDFTEAQKESLNFYVTNDYLMINNFLYGDLDKVYKGALVANQDAKDVMAEAREMGYQKRWGVSNEEGEKIYKMFESRIFDELTQPTKLKLLKRIKNDIKNIQDCMTPNEEEIIVYRNALTKSLPTDLHEGQILEFKAFSSTSLEIHQESFRHDQNIVRFVIRVPKNILLLNIYKYPEIANEKDEVLLHPIKCKVEKIIDSTGTNPKIIEVNVIEMIKINLNTNKKDYNKN